MEANPRVDKFMQDLMFTDRDKKEILVSLRELVLNVAPNAKEEVKYGGFVFER